MTEARLRAIELQLEDLRERINTTVAALKRIQQHVDLPDWRDA